MTTSLQAFVPASTALILIEFQNEWIEADGKLNHLMEDRGQFQSALIAGKKLLQFAREVQIDVYHVGLQFSKQHAELGTASFGLRSAIPKYRTFVGTAANFADGFTPTPDEFVISGRLGSSGFASSNLDSLLRFHNKRTLLIAGFALHVCVESTLRQAHDLGYESILMEDACAAFNKEQRQHVLEDVVHHFGARAKLADLAAQLEVPSQTEALQA